MFIVSLSNHILFNSAFEGKNQSVYPPPVFALEDGYLQNKTITSLISDSHFKSKKTFYNNFKKFTGKSPQEMNNTLKFKM